MAEFLVEHGIGEERAVLLERGQICAARLHWPGQLVAGQVEDAVLIHRAAGARRGTARFASGEEALVEGLGQEAAEGAPLRLIVTRSAMRERARHKLAHARPSNAALRPAPSLAESLVAEGHSVRSVAAFPPECDWEELWAQGWEGRTSFAGGALELALTPAMTVIDVDGDLPSRALALAGAPAVALALARFDIGGNIAVDFPSLEARKERRAVDEALAAALSHDPHEQTAMNGFGLVQIVRRFTHPSLLHLLHYHRTGAAARLLLRRAERAAKPGQGLLIRAHPGVAVKLSAAWLAELARRTACEVRIERDPGLALESGFAQATAL